MAINLHRVTGTSDWHSVRTPHRNNWQKVAAATHGLVTPGNAVSLLGAALVFTGLVQLASEVTTSGVLLVALGRVADAVDGYIAHATSTKSGIGEAIDSSMDKIVAAAAIITVFAYELLPTIVILVIAFHTVINSLIAIVGRLRKIELHPSLFGKLATFLIWATMLSYLVYYLLIQNSASGAIASTVYAVSWILFGVFAFLGLQSTIAYARQIKS